LYRFERTVSVLGRSESTFNNYSRHVAAISLYFGKIPTELDAEQVQDYLFYQQKKSKTPSQTYFKHCVYGLRFLLKSEGLPYEYLRLPSIKHEKKLPVVLSKDEVWAMLKTAKLLKHKILIGLLYGCGLRCMEARSVRLQDLDFDRKQLKVVQGGGALRKCPVDIFSERASRRGGRSLRSTFRTLNSRSKNLHRSRKTPRISLQRTACG
jgi:integrase